MRSWPTTFAGWSAGSATSPRRPGTGPGSTSTCTAAPASRSTPTSTRVADYLAELGRAIAHPYDLAIEHPIDAGSREAQIATYRSLRAALKARGSNVRIVVDEWCNTLDDVRAFVAAGAADVIHVKTPDLGSVGSAVEALLLARDAGLEAFCGGTCNETDRSAQVSAHVAMACEATQVLAKPGMGVDEGLMIVANEMARTAALVRAREAARRARV